MFISSWGDGRRVPLVWIVEGNRSLRMLLRENFRRRAYDVCIFNSPREVYPFLESGCSRPDLLVLDLGDGGWDLLRHYREHYDVTRVIAMSYRATVDAQDSDHFDAWCKGADEYFAKPFNPVDVLMRSQKLLGLGHRRQATR